jgi:hypothetical protein
LSTDSDGTAGLAAGAAGVGCLAADRCGDLDESMKTVAFETNEARRATAPESSSASAAAAAAADSKEARCRLGDTGNDDRLRGVLRPVDPLNTTSVGLWSRICKSV